MRYISEVKLSIGRAYVSFEQRAKRGPRARTFILEEGIHIEKVKMG